MKLAKAKPIKNGTSLQDLGLQDQALLHVLWLESIHVWYMTTNHPINYHDFWQLFPPAPSLTTNDTQDVWKACCQGSVKQGHYNLSAPPQHVCVLCSVSGILHRMSSIQCVSCRLSMWHGSSAVGPCGWQLFLCPAQALLCSVAFPF